MHVSTSTNIHQVYGGENYHFDVVQSIHRCAKAGYEVIDISMNSVSRPGMPLATAAWKELVDTIAAAIEETKVRPTQSHALFHASRGEFDLDVFEWEKNQIRRCLEASSMLQIPWVVMHPLHGMQVEGLDEQEVIEANYQYFMEFASLARSLNVGIAIENMFPSWFSTADQLLTLLDRLNDPIFGLCWDTGHANLTGQDQVASIMQMGSHLKATHIADNLGTKDDHLLPFIGNIDWIPLARALKHSGYEGDFTFEVHNVSKNFPIELREDILALSHRVGTYLISV
jgi:L-ribulose-5-phosphate 3-epimerase